MEPEELSFTWFAIGIVFIADFGVYINWFIAI
jgi:hypothetical protein